MTVVIAAILLITPMVILSGGESTEGSVPDVKADDGYGPSSKNMSGIILAFAAISFVIFIATCTLATRLAAPIRRAGIDVSALTSSRGWFVYSLCGAMVIIVWAVMVLLGGPDGEFAGTSFLAFALDAFSVTFLLRTAVDVWPAYRRLGGNAAYEP